MEDGHVSRAEEIEALVIRLIEIDDRRIAVLDATETLEDFSVGVAKTVAVMNEYKDVMSQLRALVSDDEATDGWHPTLDPPP